MNITFFVPGYPKPQGSKRGIIHRSTGKVVMVESCDQVKNWRSVVALHAAQHRPEKLMDGVITIQLMFWLPRPANHYGTGKNAHLLKPDAPHYATSHRSGDIDKLIRSILDAITGVIITDDSHVVRVNAVKMYGDGDAGVSVNIWDFPLRDRLEGME